MSVLRDVSKPDLSTLTPCQHDVLIWALEDLKRIVDFTGWIQYIDARIERADMSARYAMEIAHAFGDLIGALEQPTRDQLIANARDAFKPKLTHGRHCSCSACAAEDWTRPELACCEYIP